MVRVVLTLGVSKAGLDLPAESGTSRTHPAPGAGPSGGRQAGSGLFGRSRQNRGVGSQRSTDPLFGLAKNFMRVEAGRGAPERTFWPTHFRKDFSQLQLVRRSIKLSVIYTDSRWGLLGAGSRSGALRAKMKITPFFKTVKSEFQSTEDHWQTSWVSTAPCRGCCQAVSAQGSWGPILTRATSPSAQPVVSLMSAQPAVTTSVLLPQQGSSGSFSFPAGMQSPHLQGIRISKLHQSGLRFPALRLLP